MTIEIKVPNLGESITTGYLSRWHVADGDQVQTGQVLYELETDKITSEGTAEADGVISLSAAEGDEVEIGQVLAVIDTSAVASEPTTAASPPSEEKEGSAPKKQLSPAVRRMAEENSIDPALVTGTGKAGRVTKADMLNAIDQQKSKQIKEEIASPGPEAIKAESMISSHSEIRETRTRISPLRKRIAERLVDAQQSAALLTTFNECDLSAVIGLRKKYQEAFQKKHDVKLGFMSFFIKAVVYALQAVPKLNARIDGDELVQNHFFDIGVAVGTERGLLVPVIRNCEEQGFADIEKQIIYYAKKARTGKITIEDLQGGVFTITNGGIYGSMLSTPIVNSPQSGILGMHAIKERPVAIDGQVVIRPMMYLALTYDHRLVDGSEAVIFLVKVKEAIEEPTRLLLEL